MKILIIVDDLLRRMRWIGAHGNVEIRRSPAGFAASILRLPMAFESWTSTPEMFEWFGAFGQKNDTQPLPDGDN